MEDLKLESSSPPTPVFFSEGSDKKAEALKEIVKGKEMLTKVGSMLAGASSDAEILVKEAMGRFENAMSLLNGAEEEVGSMALEFEEENGGKKISKTKNMGCGLKRKGGVGGGGGFKRRRSNSSCSSTVITSKTLEDGFTWRKYGQKWIQHARYPRSYYRCTHKSDGCLAQRKTQKSEEDTSTYHITYIGEHTCKAYSSSTNTLLLGKNKINNSSGKRKQPCMINFKSLPKCKEEEIMQSITNSYGHSAALPVETSMPTTTLTHVSDTMSDFGDVTSNLHNSFEFNKINMECNSLFVNMSDFDEEFFCGYNI